MDENIESLFKARMTIFEMLSDRGYTFEKYEMDNNIDQFYFVYKNLTNMFGLTIQAYKSNGNIILIFFPLEMKLRVNSIRSMLDKTKYVGAKHIIIVYPGVVTTFTKQHLNTYYNTALRVEQFCVKALQFNVTKHRLVPPHSVLSKEEQQKID